MSTVRPLGLGRGLTRWVFRVQEGVCSPVLVRNPFQILGLAESLDLSPQQVQGAYLRAMASLHPDLAGADADGIDETSSVRAAEINLAKDLLVDEVSRAEALLHLRGGDGVSADKSLPDGFLPMMMQAREELDEAMQSGQETSSRAQTVQASLAWAMSKRSEALQLVREALASQQLKRARMQLNACRYIDRMIDHVRREFLTS